VSQPLLKNASQNSRGNETSQDYVFHYEVDLESQKAPAYHHRLTELAREILANLLNVIVPVETGKDVKVDSFRWLMDKEEVYQVFPRADSSPSPHESAESRQPPSSKTGGHNSAFQSTSNAAFYEPRIDLIKKLIESLSALVEFEQDGQVVKVDGFRLKNLGDWLVPSTGDPSEVFEYAGSHCNCDCVFCCNKGNPPSVATGNNLDRSTEEEFKEIKTRIKYFSPEARRALFPSLGCIYETTAHPYFLDTLCFLRKKTPKPFKITTNGSNLTPELIAKLANLRPIYLYLSLNSSSVSRRRRLMRETKPEVAINALPLLRQRGIPYAAVIVPWPVDTVEEMVEDLSSTVTYAAEHEAHLIQVNLPGYSKQFSSTELFDLEEVWRAIVSRVRQLREGHDCPIVAMPTMYEDNIYQPRKNLPEVIGLVKNSPAYLSRLKKGDVILKINGISVRDRLQARDLLSLLQKNGAKDVNLSVQRHDQAPEINLDLTRYSYPYSEGVDNYLGIIFMGTGLRVSYIERLKEIAGAQRAKRVLFLSSELVKPVFEQCLAESRLFRAGQVQIDIQVPESRFFGGNILMGDLLVVQDFIDCVKDCVTQGGSKPDLVVIPSSPFGLSGWGRDLTGRVYLDIERETGVPVELLHCATIYY